MIWSDDWIPVPSNITRSLVSCLAGSNKRSCFPFGPLMPLWASCRSLMCHSEIIALASNLLVDLEITGRQQVSPLSPARPEWGNPGVRWYWDVFLCFSLSSFCSLTTVAQKCSQLLVPPCRLAGFKKGPNRAHSRPTRRQSPGSRPF